MIIKIYFIPFEENLNTLENSLHHVDSSTSTGVPLRVDCGASCLMKKAIHFFLNLSQKTFKNIQKTSKRESHQDIFRKLSI